MVAPEFLPDISRSLATYNKQPITVASDHFSLLDSLGFVMIVALLGGDDNDRNVCLEGMN